LSKITKSDLIAFAKDDFDSFADALTEILPQFVKLKWYQDVPYKSWLPKWQKAGFTILPNHYYSPIPDLNNLTTEILKKPLPLYGVDLSIENQLILIKKLGKYKSEYNEFAFRDAPRKDGKYFLGGPFPPVDAMVAYAMVRHVKPKRIIEIGSGHSTLAMLEACHMNRQEGLPVEFLSIDPYENPVKKFGATGLSKFHEVKVQDLPIGFFESLQENDILFIDSSHVLRPGNDVEYEYFSILPSLNNGVHIHVHDVFLPKPYPSNWLTKEHIFWNEQYILAAFLAYNSEFVTTFSVSHLCNEYQTEMKSIIPDAVESLSGGSYWLKRKSP